jgi:catenin alpha
METHYEPNLGNILSSVRTKTVERLLTPLIHLVTTFNENYQPRGGGPHDGETVLRRVAKALNDFWTIGGRAINDPLAVGKPREQLKNALTNVKIKGDRLVIVGEEFIHNTNAQMRAKAIEAGREALKAVVHLLAIAESFDTLSITNQAEKVRDILEDSQRIGDTQKLVETCTNLQAEVQELTEMTRKRIKDLRDPSQQDNLQAAISMLNISTPIMIASSKAFVRRPELETARANREYAYDEMHKALDGVKAVLEDKEVSEEIAISQHGRLNDLILNLEKFQRHAYMEPSAYRPHIHRPQLEELLERIVSGAAVIADLENTRPERHTQIVAGVNNLRQALQDLLTEYENNMASGKKAKSIKLTPLCRATESLPRISTCRRFIWRIK